MDRARIKEDGNQRVIIFLLNNKNDLINVIFPIMFHTFLEIHTSGQEYLAWRLQALEFLLGPRQVIWTGNGREMIQSLDSGP